MQSSAMETGKTSNSQKEGLREICIEHMRKCVYKANPDTNTDFDATILEMEETQYQASATEEQYFMNMGVLCAGIETSAISEDSRLLVEIGAMKAELFKAANNIRLQKEKEQEGSFITVSDTLMSAELFISPLATSKNVQQ